MRAAPNTRRLLAEWMALLLAMLLVGTLFSLAWRHFYRAAYPVTYRETVVAESSRNGLSPALVLAVIRTESGFNPDAQSSVQARGLMQITPDTFHWIRYRIGDERGIEFDDLFDSGENIRYGAALLRLHLDEFGSERNALCAYHAGRTRALEWLADPGYAPDGKTIEHIPYGDTSRYVEKVLETKRTYEALYETI